MSRSSANGQRDWAGARERGHYGAMRLLVWVYRLTGRTLIAPVVHLTVLYFYFTRRATRRHSASYLRRALGRRPTRWEVWRHHSAFGMALVDRIGAWMGRIRVEDVAFDGHRLVARLLRNKQGAVLLGAHLGNLEMCRAAVENDQWMVLNVILHSRNTENFNRMLRGISERSDVRLIQVEDVTPATAIQLREKLDRGEFVVLLADRLPPHPDTRSIRYPVLGEETQLPLGPFWLALMLGAPVYFLAAFDTGRGYRAVMEPMYPGGKVPRRERDERCRKLVSTYVHWLDYYCRRYPFQWFNFFDYWGDDEPAQTKGGARGERRPTDNNKESD